MNKIRVRQDFWKGDIHFLPGRILKDELTEKEIQQRLDDGYLVVYIEAKKPKKKKVKDDKIS